eukprot:CAMPEP_0118941948 /NCGR_PEP_ID=MMETSP1169-20130426/35036_1 /TAXON_ID=36882 /ORGANISM="Pyramimonas obovata, Strain CCMP722" /LENGTH=53 /DNA_ID=CAMNT_0006886847 /DNA_START=90 /DNA_END=248 /DNA_ORIENTATION=-
MASASANVSAQPLCSLPIVPAAADNPPPQPHTRPSLSMVAGPTAPVAAPRRLR